MLAEPTANPSRRPPGWKAILKDASVKEKEVRSQTSMNIPAMASAIMALLSLLSWLKTNFATDISGGVSAMVTRSSSG